LDDSVIENVFFIISNYTNEYIIQGTLCTHQNCKIWKITEISIPILVIKDWKNINISVNILINNTYDIQKSSANVFKAYYGYYAELQRIELLECLFYNINLINKKQKLKIIGSLWLVD
jgi:hypothetical protein